MLESRKWQGLWEKNNFKPWEGGRREAVPLRDKRKFSQKEQGGWRLLFWVREIKVQFFRVFLLLCGLPPNCKMPPLENSV
jgi:hypothetical protein